MLLVQRLFYFLSNYILYNFREIWLENNSNKFIVYVPFLHKKSIGTGENTINIFRNVSPRPKIIFFCDNW